MSDFIRLSPEQIATATRLWSEGREEREVAAAIGLCVTTFRRRKSDDLASLGPRSHLDRNSGRRSEEVAPAELYRRAALVRHSWPPAERELRSRGIAAPMRPASTAPAGPFPRGHGLRVIPIDRSRR